MLHVEKFISEHKDNWKELLQKEPFNLRVSEDAHYALLKYNQLESDFSNFIVRECRGIIIDKSSLKAVALSFEKFWNIQEPLHDSIDWKTARVQEKVDGSKILVWFDKYDDRWRVSTSGTLNAFASSVNGFSDTFGSLFVEALSNIKLPLGEFYCYLNPNYCYTFELVSPKSRIVVPYNKTKIYFIGLRDVETFLELKPETESSILQLGVSTPKEYKLNSLDACLKATSKMGFDEEGFVVVDANWKRVKIKSPAYVAAHYIRNNGVTTYSRILDMIELGQDEEFLKIYPEYTDRFNEVKESKASLFNDIKDSISDVESFLRGLGSLADRKILANYITKNYEKISSFLFKFLDTDLIDLFINTEWKSLTQSKKLKYLGFKEEKDADIFKEE